jgi:hypothetical protein
MLLLALDYSSTPDRLLRSRLSTLIKTCRSERKTEQSQQVVTNGDKPLTSFSSLLIRHFTTIRGNYLLPG